MMTVSDFEHIAIKLRPRLLDVGRRFFGDNDMAEDIAQETLMRLWVIRQRIDMRIGTEALAMKMARNLCVSEWRQRQKLQIVEIQQETAESKQVDSQMVTDESILQLRRAVAQLKPAERRLFRMRYELEMDIAEINAVTGITPRSISVMLSVSKRKLKEILRTKGDR